MEPEFFGGGWTRAIAYSYTPDTCPSGFTDVTGFGCGHANTVAGNVGDTASSFIALPLVSFSEVAGTLRAFSQRSNTAWDQGRYRNQTTVEGIYVDGFSLTLGAAGQRRHVWSWAIGQGDVDVFHTNHCPCRGHIGATQYDDDGGFPTPAPAFVGQNYFCEEPPNLVGNTVETTDVLFDGESIAPACVGSFESGSVFMRDDVSGDRADGDQFELRALNPSGSSADSANELLTLFELYVR
jgi:hypothetical protein